MTGFITMKALCDLQLYFIKHRRMNRKNKASSNLSSHLIVDSPCVRSPMARPKGAVAAPRDGLLVLIITTISRHRSNM